MTFLTEKEQPETTIKLNVQHKLRIECYFIDRSKKLFEFEKFTDEKLTTSEHDQFCNESFQHVYENIDRSRLVMTWPKSYIRQDGMSKMFVELLPQLHFGKIVESCYI